MKVKLYGTKQYMKTVAMFCNNFYTKIENNNCLIKTYFPGTDFSPGIDFFELCNNYLNLPLIKDGIRNKYIEPYLDNIIINSKYIFIKEFNISSEIMPDSVIVEGATYKIDYNKYNIEEDCFELYSEDVCEMVVVNKKDVCIKEFNKYIEHINKLNKELKENKSDNKNNISLFTKIKNLFK